MTAIPHAHDDATLPSAFRSRRLWQYRELIWMLARRDISARYKHSLLGAAWAVLPPLAMMVVFSFVFGTIADVDRGRLTGHATLPYGLFAMCGLVPWMLLAGGLSSATTSLVANRRLVTKVYFPREVLPLSSILSALVDFVVAFGLLAAMVGYYHLHEDGWTYQLRMTVLAMPLVLMVQLVFMSALGLLLSMANLFYRDVNFLFRSVVQLWMFVTCVVYDLRAETPWMRAIIEMNPMTPIIRAYRDCLLYGKWPVSREFLGAAVVSVVLLILAAAWFRRREEDFAEVV